MKGLVMTEKLRCKGRSWKVNYYWGAKTDNVQRYFAKISIDGRESIILDGDYLFDLRARTKLLFPILLRARSI